MSKNNVCEFRRRSTVGDSVKELGPAVRLSQSDINEIKKAMADGIEFEVRQVASEKKRIVTSFDL